MTRDRPGRPEFAPDPPELLAPPDRPGSAAAPGSGSRSCPSPDPVGAVGTASSSHEVTDVRTRAVRVPLRPPRRRSPRPPPPPRRGTPGDRRVPATFNVNSLADILNPPAGTVTLRSAIPAATDRRPQAATPST